MIVYLNRFNIFFFSANIFIFKLFKKGRESKEFLFLKKV